MKICFKVIDFIRFNYDLFSDSNLKKILDKFTAKNRVNIINNLN